MKLPDLRNFDLSEKKVLLRVDFDVPLTRPEGQRAREREENNEWVVADDTRIANTLPTIKYLLAQGAKIILLSHLGRPEGKVIPDLSLEPVSETLSLLLCRNKVKEENGWRIGEEIFLRENLRFDLGEENNDPEFAKRLATLGDFYINDAFAASHREHASIVGLPKLLSHAAGLALLKEVSVLSGVLENPKRPVVVILGGVKEDKLEAIPGLLKFADHILIGGRLPLLVTNYKNVLVAGLNQEGKDITLETVEKFGEIIGKAGTIVWAGPLGQYEMLEGELGTKQIAQAVTDSSAYKIIGGGDTEAALTKFGLVEKIDFVSSGGGAMLEFLANGDLPGLKALRE